MDQTPSELLLAKARNHFFHNGGTIPQAIRFILSLPENQALARRANLSERAAVELANSASASPARTTTARHTPSAVQAAVREEMHRLMRANPTLREGDVYDQAWNNIRRSTGEFANAMESNLFANADGGGFSDGTRMTEAPGPALKSGQGNATGYKAANLVGVSADDLEKYQLPFDATQDELNAAKSGGTKLQSIWDALVKHTASSRGIGADVAATFCWGRFQKLASQVDTGTGFKLNSSQGTSRSA